MATILGTFAFSCTIVGIQGAEITNNILSYYPDGHDGIQSGQGVAQAWLTDILPAWLDAVSEQWTFAELRWSKSLPGGGTTGFEPVNQAGTVLADVLPPFNTARLIKQPDNSEIDPVGALPFRNGGIALAGVPESFQDNSVATIGALSAYALLGIALPTFVAGAQPWKMYIRRAGLPGEGAVAAVPVSEVSFSRFGTQNTRKR